MPVGIVSAEVEGSKSNSISAIPTPAHHVGVLDHWGRFTGRCSRSHADASQQVLYPIEMHSFHTDSPGPLTLLDMPVVDMVSKGFAKCFVDVIVDVQGNPPVNEIKASLQAKAMKERPQPYGLASETAGSFKFDLAIIKQNNGNHMVVKIVNLSEKTKVERTRDTLYHIGCGVSG